MKPKVVLRQGRHWVLALLALVCVLHLTNPSRAWIALLLSIGGSMSLSYLWARQMATRVSVTRERRYGWVHVGDLLEERFELVNDSLLPVLWAEIDDWSDLPGYSASSVRSADGGQTVQWRTEGMCQQRGLFSLGPWQVHLRDPFGFFSVTLDHAESLSIMVYPPVVHLPSVLLPKGAATAAGRTSHHALDVTTNVASVRGYAEGDSLRWVHWPTSAHRDSLMVKTFDLEPSGDLWIVLDLDSAVQIGEGPESTEEYAVMLASSLAARTLRENRAVGLAAYGTGPRQGGHDSEPKPTLVMPKRGSAQQWTILQSLATVRAGGDWPLENVLAELDSSLGRGMTLAVITSSCSADWLAGLLPPMRRGVAPTVLLIDPESFGGTGRAPVLRGLLADLGIPSHVISKGMPFAPLLKHKRIGRPEYRVLPATGRVIAVER